METVVGIRFKKAGKVYYFDPGDLDLNPGDHVVVETSRGLEYGEVAVAPKQVDSDQIVAPLKKVIRKATPDDTARLLDFEKRKKEPLEICQRRILAFGLPMKLVDVEYAFDGSKVTFYFTAEGRVDFRELVRDLASIFRMRIELRQIGVRDQAKMLGGLGPCGRPLCCATFLGDFEPVSIRMAKEQDLSLNPMKISGLCGRLMCCLKFESEVYREARATLPSVGNQVETPMGRGKVVSINVLKGAIKVEFEDGTQAELDACDLTCGSGRMNLDASPEDVNQANENQEDKGALNEEEPPEAGPEGSIGTNKAEPAPKAPPSYPSSASTGGASNAAPSNPGTGEGGGHPGGYPRNNRSTRRRHPGGRRNLQDGKGTRHGAEVQGRQGRDRNGRGRNSKA